MFVSEMDTKSQLEENVQMFEVQFGDFGLKTDGFELDLGGLDMILRARWMKKYEKICWIGMR